VTPQRTADVSELRQMISRSGVIFGGRVLSVEYLRPRFSDEVPSMRITFRVERGIRGTRTGNRFVLREWAALWNGSERYQVGERVLLLFIPQQGGECAELFEKAVTADRRPNWPKTRVRLGDVSRMIRRFQAEEMEP
jgi:hypothetical protein